MINMSCLPEAKLAREAEIAYQMICMSTDYDCWRSGAESVTVEMVMGNMKSNADNAKRFIQSVLDELTKETHGKLVTGSHLAGAARMGLSTPISHLSPDARGRLTYLFPQDFSSPQ